MEERYDCGCPVNCNDRCPRTADKVFALGERDAARGLDDPKGALRQYVCDDVPDEEVVQTYQDGRLEWARSHHQ